MKTVSVFGSGSRTFVFNVNLLVNISPPLIECSVGDKLKIISNAKKFKRVQKHVVKNWNDSMKRFAGRPCTVVQIPESSRTTETDDTDETILDEIGVKLYGNDEIVTVSRKVVECFQEDLFEGEKVVSLLSGSQLVEITGNDAFKNYNNQVYDFQNTTEINFQNSEMIFTGVYLRFQTRCEIGMK